MTLFARIIFFISVLPPVGFGAERLPAFPGAEGFGAYTSGGRGGTVLAVTNLNDEDHLNEPGLSPSNFSQDNTTTHPLWREIIFFLFQAIFISLSGVMAPGAVTTATIAAGTRSRHAGVMIALGHGLIEFPLMFAILAGMGRLFEMEVTKFIIGLAGGGFLLWMGSDMLRNLSKQLHSTTTPINRKPFWTGFILSVSNPYFLLWWATIGLALAKDARKLGLLAFVLFTIVHWLCDLGWLEALSWTTFKGSKLIGEKNLRWVLMVCAMALLFFGGIFIYRAVFPS